MNDSCPTNGSVMILNTSAANGSVSEVRRTTGVLPSGSVPSTGGTSTGDGR